MCRCGKSKESELRYPELLNPVIDGGVEIMDHDVANSIMQETVSHDYRNLGIKMA